MLDIATFLLTSEMRTIKTTMAFLAIAISVTIFALQEGKLGLPQPEKLPNSDLVSTYVLVGDSIFALNKSLMRPFVGRFLPESERIFNYRLSRARRTIENTFGITASRFRILRRPIVGSPQKITSVIKAVVVLHNFLMANESPLPLDARIYFRNDLDEGQYEDRNTCLVSRRPTRARYPLSAKIVRENFKKYFMSPEGQVPWQMEHVRADGNSH